MLLPVTNGTLFFSKIISYKSPQNGTLFFSKIISYKSPQYVETLENFFHDEFTMDFLHSISYNIFEKKNTYPPVM